MVDVGQTPAIGLRPTLGRRLDAAARRCVPVAFTLFLLLVAGALPGLPGQAALRPALVLIAVFHWSLLRPASMPPAAVFAIGLLCDLFGWIPIGIGAITLLAAQAAALRLRAAVARRGRIVVWFAFPAVATAVAAATWGFASLLTLALLPPGPALLQAVFAVALYPALALVLGWADRGIAAPERV